MDATSVAAVVTGAQTDEELARSLQALDNGLRRRKRSSSGFGLEQLTPGKTKKSARNRREQPDSTTTISSKTSKRQIVEQSPSRSSTRTAISKSSNPANKSSSPAKRKRGEEKKVREIPSSPLVPALNAKRESEEERPARCQGCGRVMSHRGAPSADDANPFACGSCVSLYHIPPCVGAKKSKDYSEGPDHSCAVSQCQITFLKKEQLDAHMKKHKGS